MRKQTFLLQSATVAITLSVFLFVAACHKDSTTTTTTNSTTAATTEDATIAANNSTSEKTFNDVQTVSDQAVNSVGTATTGSLGYRSTSGGCGTIHHSTDTTIIDFGTSDCTCRDGRTRRGKIIVVHTGGHYADSGHVHTITFDNYFVNDNQVTGSKTVQNMGHNSAGQLYYNVSINGSIILAGGAGTISEVSTRVRTWISGSATPLDWTDDVYQISGSGTLTSATGTVVTMTISSPLEVHGDCRWIEAGTVTFTNGTKSRSINYGTTASCDDSAVVTLSTGATRTITLP